MNDNTGDTFKEVSDYAHSDVCFEQLQNKCLELAWYVDELVEENGEIYAETITLKAKIIVLEAKDGK